MYIIHDCLPIFEMSISSIVAPIVNTPWPGQVSALTCGSPARLLVRDYDLVSVLPRPEHVRGGLALRLAHQPEHIHYTQERKWLEYPRLVAHIHRAAVSWINWQFLFTFQVYNTIVGRRILNAGLPFLSLSCPGGILLSRDHHCDYLRPIKGVITSQHHPSLRTTAGRV